jgi:hypothetical protein
MAVFLYLSLSRDLKRGGHLFAWFFFWPASRCLNRHQVNTNRAAKSRCTVIVGAQSFDSITAALMLIYSGADEAVVCSILLLLL